MKRAPADLDRIEDDIISVQGSAVLLNLAVVHGTQHLSGIDAQAAIWHANRQLASDVSELRRVYNSVHSATNQSRKGDAA